MPCPIAQFDAQFCAYRVFLEVRARRSVRQENAEDLVCQCYLEARKSLARYYCPYDATSPLFKRSLLAWLIGILDNLLRLHFRKAHTQREDLFADPALLTDGPDSQMAHCAFQEAEWRRLLQRMGSVDLTTRQYECILRVLQGETQQQIADSLHISPRMASYHVQAALKHFADYNESNANKEQHEEEDDFRDAFDFFCQCAHQNLYRKPHSFDNQSTSEERERRRYACLREAVTPVPSPSGKSKRR